MPGFCGRRVCELKAIRQTTLLLKERSIYRLESGCGKRRYSTTQICLLQLLPEFFTRFKVKMLFQRKQAKPFIQKASATCTHLNELQMNLALSNSNSNHFWFKRSFCLSFLYNPCFLKFLQAQTISILDKSLKLQGSNSTIKLGIP